MATVSAKMLSPSGSNLSASKTIDTEKRTRLTVTRNSNPWIYSNYPEAIGKNGKGLALAENGYFLNQQTISGTAEVFYSHTNYTEKKLYVGIQAYNGSSKSVTVTCQNYGDSSGWNKSINAVKNFFFEKDLRYHCFRQGSMDRNFSGDTRRSFDPVYRDVSV